MIHRSHGPKCGGRARTFRGSSGWIVRGSVAMELGKDSGFAEYCERVVGMSDDIFCNHGLLFLNG